MGHSLRGKDQIQYDNPFDVGMTGLLGDGAAAEGLHDADVMLSARHRLPVPPVPPGRHHHPGGHRSHRDRGAAPGVDIPVHGDVSPRSSSCCPSSRSSPTRRLLDKTLAKHDKLMNKAVGVHPQGREDDATDPEYAASILDQAAADAVFTADTACATCGAPATSIRWYGPHRAPTCTGPWPTPAGDRPAQLAEPGTPGHLHVG
ncbi:hypothetical protein QJS66_08360 [Kocuria rhizophila]|nr:hypothetical protein QJS66_08360 [Kocuria rhizophila]